MTSIRFFLVAALISAITLVNFVAALHGYRQGMKNAEALFDSQLNSQLELLRVAVITQGFINDDAKQRVIQFKPLSDQGFFVFQIWSVDEQNSSLLLHSPDAPEQAVIELESGYHYVNFSGYRWRTLIQRDEQYWFVVAQRDDARYFLAEAITSAAVWPIIISVPLLGFVIWCVVGIGLRPLQRLASELSKKEATDLTPISDDGIPKELTRLTHSANDLLFRLEASFFREKRFSADAAHELRTPISILKVHIDNLLADSHLAKTQPSDTVIKLKAGVDRIQNLVEQMLDLNRTAPDNYSANFTQVDIYKLAREVIASNIHLIEQRRQNIELKGESTSLYGDEFSLSVLIQNLLTNASKFTPDEGEILLTIKRLETRVILEVMDSGPGIDKAYHQRVFDRFYRVGGDRHDANIMGCGLGLAIVQHIVTAHEAEIVFNESTFKSGLLVTVIFNQQLAQQRHLT